MKGERKGLYYKHWLQKPGANEIKNETNIASRFLEKRMQGCATHRRKGGHREKGCMVVAA